MEVKLSERTRDRLNGEVGLFFVFFDDPFEVPLGRLYLGTALALIGDRRKCCSIISEVAIFDLEIDVLDREPHFEQVLHANLDLHTNIVDIKLASIQFDVFQSPRRFFIAIRHVGNRNEAKRIL